MTVVDENKIKMTDDLLEAHNSLYQAFLRYREAKSLKNSFSLYERSEHEDMYLDLKDQMHGAMEEMENCLAKITICRQAQRPSLTGSDKTFENK
jgi:hypothetical protein